eukprot:CAMPEP_0197186404 /NCGR_PEP_ID=MMETSP1423-20130617/13847_1 /TAXON_ID=476441 /ORGANISM="Pseudo-nitzschia heimii, Strain UNC1101" /LENGTH=68 /DNA_ID=CAMNT_0042637709 /DNA_START=1 /DNA_END=207 /DNA_ORIENTATION=-
MGSAFAPIKVPSKLTSTTTLQFGFLKELGLEKPSWLPDFGGKKDKEESPASDDEKSSEETTGDGAAEE